MTDSARTSDEITPPPIGNLEQHAPASLLAAIERMRFTGELRFTVGQKTHAVDVRGGVASDEPEHARAMELFLAAVSGPYELREQLPVLPSGVRKNSLCVGGSLSDTSPAELLNFCESIGLTGKLSLDSEGRECLARYVKGELVSLMVDGQDDGALDAVFAWRAGSYQIQQRNAFDEEGPSSITDLRPALGTIEVALSEILARSAKNKGTAPIPSIAPPGKPKPKTIPPTGGVPSPDQSVKIIFRAPKLERDSKTAHASANMGREVVALDTATASGPLDDAKAEAIVAKARAAEAERERAERDANDRKESAANALSSAKPSPSPAESAEPVEPAAPPSRALSAVIAATLVIALLVGLWSLVSMAGSAR